MSLTRRQRRLALATALVVLLAFTWVFTRPPADSEKFYAYLEPRPWLRQVVRIGFVLVGKQEEFDQQILVAAINRILIIDQDVTPRIDLLNLHDSPPAAP